MTTTFLKGYNIGLSDAGRGTYDPAAPIVGAPDYDDQVEELSGYETAASDSRSPDSPFVRGYQDGFRDVRNGTHRRKVPDHDYQVDYCRGYNVAHDDDVAYKEIGAA